MHHHQTSLLPTTRRARAATWMAAAAAATALLLSGCASPGNPTPIAADSAEIALPLVPGWHAGQRVWYITTDISDPAMAAQGGANLVPRLAHTLPPQPRDPSRPGSVERIYKFADASQPSVLPSAPQPLGGANRNAAYSPLWQLVMVRWQPGQPRTELRSEEELLAAEEAGRITLQPTAIVVNCPVVQVGDQVLAGARRLR